MAKKHKSPPPPEPDPNSEDAKASRAKMRALIISALAAGGAFQMNSWQIQAHGNRSSHEVLAFQTPTISPDDYILMRQILTGPKTTDTDQLVQLTAQLKALGGGQNMVALTESHQKLLNQKRAVEKKLGIPSTTRQVLQFLHQDDTAGAIAAIEGQGWPERVLQDYQWTLLDIAYLDEGNGQKFTPKQQQDFLAIAKPALTYGEKVLTMTKGHTSAIQQKAAQERVAEILHNVASFIVLMDGADESTLSFGLKAAERALEVRQELKEPATILRANWMVAQYHIRANRTPLAMNYLRTSLQQAEQLNDVPGIAWAKYSMANALRQKPLGVASPLNTKSNPQATKLETEAKNIVSQFKGQDTTIEFLRTEFQK